MATKSQHNRMYRILPSFLKQMRENSNLTQREIAKKLKKAQSWVYNCETANRRVDITEFISWAKACEVNPKTAFNRLLKELE